MNKFDSIWVFDNKINKRRTLNAIEISMLETVSSCRVRSNVLFKRLNLDELEGRDVLSRLIDSGFIAVSEDWSLYVRKEMLGL